MSLPPDRSTFHCSGIEIENGTYRSAMAMDLQLLPMGICPFFLFGGGHTYPKQIRVCLIDSFDYRLIILFRELRFIGWRISFHFNVGIIHFYTLFYQCQYFFTAAHEKTFPSGGIQFVHFKLEEVPAGNAFFRLRFCIQPTTCLDNACSVGDQYISLLQSFGKELVFLGGVVGMGVDGVDQEFARKQSG